MLISSIFADWYDEAAAGVEVDPGVDTWESLATALGKAYPDPDTNGEYTGAVVDLSGADAGITVEIPGIYRVRFFGTVSAGTDTEVYFARIVQYDQGGSTANVLDGDASDNRRNSLHAPSFTWEDDTMDYHKFLIDGFVECQAGDRLLPQMKSTGGAALTFHQCHFQVEGVRVGLNAG